MINENLKTRQCATCKEMIYSDAAKCVHCGSFQNWRRHYNFSSSLLSMMVAFISVLTIFVSVVMNSTIKNDSDINVSIIN